MAAASETSLMDGRADAGGVLLLFSTVNYGARTGFCRRDRTGKAVQVRYVPFRSGQVQWKGEKEIPVF